MIATLTASHLVPDLLDHDERNDAPVAFIGLDTIALADAAVPPDPAQPTFAMHTLGCKLNSADAQALTFALREQGFREVSFGARADLYIVNTCTVTHVADKKNRQYLRRARVNGGEDAMVAAVGCYTSVAPEDAAAMAEVDLVLGSADKEQVVAAAVTRFADRLSAVGLMDTHLHARAAGRTRRFIKIQEGCDARCTFCIVPLARGPSVSVAAERVCHEVAEAAEMGYREVILTGTYVGMFDERLADGTRLRLPDLLRRVLAGLTPPRIRLTSVGPAELKPDLLALWADTRLAPHLHMPIQSGSAAVLRAMRRRYNPDQFRHATERVRAAIADCSLTTDVIVGFPGETEADFTATLAFCADAGFTKIHAFPYSERAGTEAAGLPGQVPTPIKKERMARLLALSDTLSAAHHRRFVGQTRPVLFETREPNGRWSGLTDNYIRVLALSDADLHNCILPTRLTAATAAYAEGEIERSTTEVQRAQRNT